MTLKNAIFTSSGAPRDFRRREIDSAPSRAFPSTQYLGQNVQWYPTFSSDNPKNSGALAHWEILALPPSEDPNTGTSGVGIFSAYCQTVGKNPPHYFGSPILCVTNVNGHTYQGN
jgi:hypothetical protein